MTQLLRTLSKHSVTLRGCVHKAHVGGIRTLCALNTLHTSPYHSSSSFGRSLAPSSYFSSQSSLLQHQQRQQRLFSTAVAAQQTTTITPFNLADIGEGIAEAELLQWFVKPGDHVSEFDKICEVQSDKATVEITSRYEGEIKKLYYDVSEMAKVGSPLVDIAVLGEESAGEASSSSDNQSAAPEEKIVPIASSVVEREAENAKVLAAPVVRRIAKEKGIDLSAVRPSGKGGRVLKEDIFAYLENASVSSSSVSSETSASGSFGDACAEIPSTVHIPTPAAEDKVIEVKGLQRIMVKTMTAANSIPHFGFNDEIEMSKCTDLRTHLRPYAEKKGVKLSFMPFFIKALSLSLLEFPTINSHVNSDCSQITLKAAHNIGIAMDTPRGLIVPNIKNVESKSILEIASELNRLQALGKEGRLGKEDLTGGTITLSNIGAVGGTYASPILFAPEVAICALGKVQTLPRFNSKGEVIAANLMSISWSADHRAVDGATMARFSCLWKDFLENPESLLLGMK
eukprot:Nk52_evm8s271 gene=Nk52_evmTU8s271